MSVEAPAPSPAFLLVRPVSGPAQVVRQSAVNVDPGAPMEEFSDIYGNCCQKLILPQGPSLITATCEVEVCDQIDVDFNADFTPVTELPNYAVHYLLPSRYCPSDLMLELATEIINGATPGYGQVEAIRQWIHDSITYEYGSSGPTTTAWDTANVRKGVCRDFAHLGVSLCRAVRIPARMVSGYLYQLNPMDLHAWFEAFIGGRWYTFDATQTEAKGNRIVMAYGRDAADIALMSEYGPIQMNNMEVWVNG